MVTATRTPRKRGPAPAMPVLSTEGLSEYLDGIPVSTLNHWRCEGKGPDYIKVGPHVRYVIAKVDEWLASLESGDERSTPQKVA